MARLYSQSPLQALTIEVPGEIDIPELKIREIKLENKFLLQGNNQQIADFIQRNMNMSFPDYVNQATFDERGQRCFKLRPNQWLLIFDTSRDVEFANAHIYITNVSDKYYGIEVSGEQASALLATGCSVNFDISAFIPGSCTQSLIDRAPAIIYRHPTRQLYQIYVESTLAHHQWLWFCQASKEFSVHTL